MPDLHGLRGADLLFIGLVVISVVVAVVFAVRRSSSDMRFSAADMSSCAVLMRWSSARW